MTASVRLNQRDDALKRLHPPAALTAVRSRRTPGATGLAILPRGGRGLQYRGTDGIQRRIQEAQPTQTSLYPKPYHGPATGVPLVELSQKTWLETARTPDPLIPKDLD